MIKKDILKIHITKLDDTVDIKGCLYTKNFVAVMKKLGVLLEFGQTRTHKSSSSCF